MCSAQEAAKATTVVPSVDSRVLDDFLDDMDHDIEEFLYHTNANQDDEKSELEKYLKEDSIQWNDKVDESFDILSRWRSKQDIYPILARLACDVLAIQVSTVALESAFSAGGRVVDPFRTRLDPEVVEALICTKDWTAATKRAAKVKIASLIDELDMLMLEPKDSTIEPEDEMVESSDEND